MGGYGTHQKSIPVDTLLQRQMEVSGGLRDKVKTPQALLEVYHTMKRLSSFAIKIGRLATRMQLPLEIVFQCLMQMGIGEEGVAFDKQARDGNVPMHQAKVLDRNASLNAAKVEPKLRETVNDEAAVEEMVENCGILRRFLRMKVEDGNDLSMARKLVDLSYEYLQCIYDAAEGNGEKMFAIYNADDEQTLSSLMYGDEDGEGIDGVPGSSHGRKKGKALPENLEKGIAHETRALTSKTTPVNERQEVLVTVLHWLESAEDSQVGSHFPGICAALVEPLKVQLAEKRSAICRAACDIVSTLCMRSNGTHFTVAKVREVFTAWIEILLKSVHVTVGAIATACDATVRDIVVASQGAGFVISVISHVVQKATQVEQRRKCLAYIAIAMIASQDKKGFTSLCHVSQKFSANGDGETRKNARTVGILLDIFDSEAAQNLRWDAKVAKVAEQERPLILDASSSVEKFEVVVLKYQEPCKASLYHGENKESFPKHTSPSRNGGGVSKPTSAVVAKPVPFENVEGPSASNSSPNTSGDVVEAKRNRFEDQPKSSAAQQAPPVITKDEAPKKERTTRPSIAEIRAEMRAKKKAEATANTGAEIGGITDTTEVLVAVKQPRRPIGVKPSTADPVMSKPRMPHSSSTSTHTKPALSAEDASTRQPERRVTSALPLSLASLSPNEVSAPAQQNGVCNGQGVMTFAGTPEPTTPQQISASLSSLKRKRGSLNRNSTSPQ